MVLDYELNDSAVENESIEISSQYCQGAGVPLSTPTAYGNVPGPTVLIVDTTYTRFAGSLYPKEIVFLIE